ncbi:MAG: hypothetical protein WA584_08390 [Pyrinomonadaceae bacterium]
MKKYLSLICCCLTVGIIICIGNICIVAQQLTIKEQQLKNGLRVFFVEDHTAPVVTVEVSYRRRVKGIFI